MIIYYSKFKTIFADKLINNSQVEIKKINNASLLLLLFILFIIFLLMTIIMLIVDFATNTSQMAKFIDGEFGILALIALLVYLFVYSRILYLSMFNNQPKISRICKIPFACSFV